MLSIDFEKTAKAEDGFWIKDLGSDFHAPNEDNFFVPFDKLGRVFECADGGLMMYFSDDIGKGELYSRVRVHHEDATLENLRNLLPESSYMQFFAEADEYGVDDEMHAYIIMKSAIYAHKKEDDGSTTISLNEAYQIGCWSLFDVTQLSQEDSLFLKNNFIADHYPDSPWFLPVNNLELG